MGSSPLDRKIKGSLCADMFHLVGFVPYDDQVSEVVISVRHKFIRSVIIQSFVHLLVHLLFIHSFVCLFVHSFVYASYFFSFFFIHLFFLQSPQCVQLARLCGKTRKELQSSPAVITLDTTPLPPLHLQQQQRRQQRGATPHRRRRRLHHPMEVAAVEEAVEVVAVAV